MFDSITSWVEIINYFCTWRVFEDGQRWKGFKLWTFIVDIVHRDLYDAGRGQLMEWVSMIGHRHLRSKKNYQQCHRLILPSNLLNRGLRKDRSRKSRPVLKGLTLTKVSKENEDFLHKNCFYRKTVWFFKLKPFEG